MILFWSSLEPHFSLPPVSTHLASYTVSNQVRWTELGIISDKSSKSHPTIPGTPQLNMKGMSKGLKIYNVFMILLNQKIK